MKIGGLLISMPDGTVFSGYARLLSKRNMGNICFCHVRFQEDQIQIVLRNGLDNYRELVGLPLGSLLHLVGNKIVTKTGMPSLEVIDAQAMFVYGGNMPDKRHGLTSALRYRKRVEDLTTNPEAFLFAKKMSHALSVIRMLLYEKGFHEFITGVLQETFEAGQANSFETHCLANDKTLFLSLTSELKLRRLIVSGFDKVFEIAQSFRNEGIDALHSPEFTMLEVYAVDADYRQMMNLLEELVSRVVRECEGDEAIVFIDDNGDGKRVCYNQAFVRLPFRQAFEGMVGNWEMCDLGVLSETYPELFNTSMTRFTWLMKVIEKLMVPRIINPTFLTELPIGMSPFVKNNQDGMTSERAFLIAQGLFLADIYSDENDVSKLSDALERQSGEAGNEVNREYLEVMNMGVPPKTAGIGMGLNRLLMLLLGSLPRNIKETILYPIL